jgi:flavodoxin
MKTLIVYYSFSGNNEFLAQELQKRLDCDIQKIVELKQRKSLDILFDLIFKRSPKIRKFDFDLKQYDRLILIAPIWDGKIATPLRSFIDLEKDNFKEYSFIAVCTGPEGQDKKITNELLQLTQREPKTVMQLKINDLLPPERKNKIKYATPYRINQRVLLAFEMEIEQFLQAL